MHPQHPLHRFQAAAATPVGGPPHQENVAWRHMSQYDAAADDEETPDSGASTAVGPGAAKSST